VTHVDATNEPSFVLSFATIACEQVFHKDKVANKPCKWSKRKLSRYMQNTKLKTFFEQLNFVFWSTQTCLSCLIAFDVIF